MLPPLVIGVFDQFVSARILDRYPQLYILGQKNTFFTKKTFWLWVVNALYHSLVSETSIQAFTCRWQDAQILFGFSIILFWGDLKQASGLDSGHWFWGTTLYLAVLLTVLGKAALISEWVLSFSPQIRAKGFPCQPLDQVHGGCYPRVLRLHHAFPSYLCGHSSSNRLLDRICRYRSAIMDGCRFLLCPPPYTFVLSIPRLRVEIVSDLDAIRWLSSDPVPQLSTDVWTFVVPHCSRTSKV